MRSKLISRIILFAIFNLLALGLFSACDTAETNYVTASLSFSSGANLNKGMDGTFQLDTVKILLRDIKIKNQSANDGHPVKVGPFVVYLNLEGMTTDFAVGNIFAGTYDRVKFEIHKVGAAETSPDPEFWEGNDSNLRYSVIVKGKYNSEDFIYKSRKSAKQDLKLETPVEVGENEIANLTITVDPYTWFYDDTTPLDPTNPDNESEIDKNIKESFKKCFRDDNRDGTAD